MSGHGPVTRAPSQQLAHTLMGSGACTKDSDGTTLHGSLEDLLSEHAIADHKSASDSLGGNGSMWMGSEDGK